MLNRNLIVQQLITAGADLNSQTNDGITALMFCKLFLNNILLCFIIVELNVSLFLSISNG